MATKTFRKEPTSRQVQAVLDEAARVAGRHPRHLVSDKGVRFDCPDYERWCKSRDVKPRFGAVGKIGSIAVIERFFRSLKSECLRRLPFVPFRSADICPSSA